MKTAYRFAYVLIVLAIALNGFALTNGSSVPPVPPQPADSTSVSERGPVESAPALLPVLPKITIPGVPTSGNCCLYQVAKKFEGKRTVQMIGASYDCGQGAITSRASVTINLPLVSGGLPCDPQPSLIPNFSKLAATGTMIKRNDGFAHFLGEFSITNSGGTVLFKGTIETLDRLASHHFPFNCEACDLKSHIEGWLVGEASDWEILRCGP